MNKKNSRVELLNWLNEALEEVRNLDFGTTPSQSVATSTQGQAPVAAAPAHSKGQTWFPSPQYAYFADENGNYKLVVRLKGIHAQHQNRLVDKWNQQYGSFMEAVIKRLDKSTDKNSAAPIDLIVNPENEDDLKAAAPAIAQDIASENGKGGRNNTGIPGFYSDRAIKEFPSKLVAVVESAPTKEEIEKSEERKAMTLDSLMAKINDPEIISKIGKITGVVNWQPASLVNGLSPAHQLSNGNKMEVYIQLPNATFVTNTWTWLNKYNRTIKDLSEYAIVKKPSNNKPKDLKAFNKAAELNGYKDASGKLSPYDYYMSLKNAKDPKTGEKLNLLSQAQIFAVEALANMYTPTSTDFISEKVYDVANTELIPGARDVWAEEVDFKDNLQGIANDAALNADIKAAAEANNATANAKITVPQSVMAKSTDEIIEAIDTLKAICLQDCGTTPGTASGTLGDQIFHLAKFWAENQIKISANKPAERDAIFGVFGLLMARMLGAETTKGDEVQRSFLYAKSGNSMDLAKTALTTYQDFKKLLLRVDADLRKKSNKMIKAGLQTTKTQIGAPIAVTSTGTDNSANAATAQSAQTTTDGNYQKVVEESISEGGFPISQEEYYEVVKDFEEKAESELNTEEIEVNDAESKEQIQESFFKFLDKMDGIF